MMVSLSDLLDRFRQVRAATEAVCAPLSPEDAVVQSMPEASPAKWHLAHTSWFFETFLLTDPKIGCPPFDPAFGYLFNSYYEAVGPRHPRPRRGLLTRPTLGEVYGYRSHVDVAVEERLQRLGEEDRHRLFPVLELGLNHEQQHLELILTDIKHAFAQNPLRPVYREEPVPAAAGEIPPASWTTFPAGVYSIGHAGAGFAFDNETPRHRVFLEKFEVASRPVTCGEFLTFVDDGGYARPELWLSDGWHTHQAHVWESPSYWERHTTCWRQFTLGGTREVNPAEPVCHVSFYEADAFARWAGARLPTEAEWEVAAPEILAAADPFAPARLHPAPLTADCHSHPTAAGAVWEWTQSAYAAYPGYRPAAGALGEYNGKFMCNQLVLRGGSCLTPRSHLRFTYRNFFPPETRWQFTGLRLARSL
jgi:ergothioneine biosynthesis protein EgtB